MTIPKGVNFAHFYWEAKKKGIKIRSRYPSINPWEGRKGGVLYWTAIAGKTKGDAHYLRKLFPFTESGEEDAHAFLVQWKEKFGIRTTHSRVKRGESKLIMQKLKS